MEKAFWVVEITLHNSAYSFDEFFSRVWGDGPHLGVAVQSSTM